jgi:hypothetical protein
MAFELGEIEGDNKQVSSKAILVAKSQAVLTLNAKT